MAGDPNYNSVSLLLHGAGADNSTTFVDNSPRPKTATVYGSAKISTERSVFGGSSMKFDGAGSYLTFPDHSDFEFGGGDFNIRTWLHLSGYANNDGGQYQSYIVGKDSGSGSGVRGIGFGLSGTASSFTKINFLGFTNDTTVDIQGASYTFALNTDYFVEVSRVGNKLYFFVDGALLNPGGSSFTTTIQNTSTSLRVGAAVFDATYTYYLNGFLEDLAITKVAGNTADYTPPTRPNPNGLGEVEGTVYDDSGVPCARVVRLHRRDTGALVISGSSDATTGTYRLATATLDEVQRVVLDDGAGTLYNDIIDRVIPA